MTEKQKKHNNKLREINTKHGLCKHPLYRTFMHIKDRCYNKNDKRYIHYGKRGIILCKEWKNNPKLFIEWCLNNGYKKNLSLDRIDNNGNYEPNNCRFITQKEQLNNRRNNVFISSKNKTMTIAQWADFLDIKYITLFNRIKRCNGNYDKALYKKVGKYKTGGMHND
jgi:hypothetical protein